MKKYFIAIGKVAVVVLFMGIIFNLNLLVFAETIFGPNVRVDDTGSATYGQWAASVAVDTNGNIYVVWVDTRNRGYGIYIAKSTDGGASFGPNVRVDDRGSFPNHPSLAIDIAGNIYVAWEDERNSDYYDDIYFAKSTDGGASFGPNVRVDDTGVSTIWQGNCSMAIDINRNIYVTWDDKRNGNIDIYFAKSTDGGASFGPNIRVDDTGSSISWQAGSELAVDLNGNIYVAWDDERNGNWDIYFAKSTDGGASFGPNVRVDNTSVSTSWQYASSLAVNSNGNIYVAWSDNRNGNYDIYFAKSTDGGVSFGPNVRVDDSTTGCQQTNSIAVDLNGNVYITWDDERNGNCDIYFAKSTDGGVSFSPNVRIDDTGSSTSPQENPSIAVDLNGNVYITWGDGRNGNADIYFAKGIEGWSLNMTTMPWYETQALYNSTGAATSQMILNYIREGAGEPLLSQDEIYEYAKAPQPYGSELIPDEVDKVLGHFDPYDYLVSNWADGYDSYPDGNPYQGYNYTVDTYDPGLNPNAINEYMRDICHWMAYPVTKEDWWEGRELVARPNTPAAIPIYGTYSHWIALKGCVTSATPCSEPHTNPWHTPDFTVYGFWMKDPQVSGIGRDTYKTAAECQFTYFQPLATEDAYNGLFVQVAEPPAERSTAKVEIPKPSSNLANLEFIGRDAGIKNNDNDSQIMEMSLLSIASNRVKESPIRKQTWQDIVEPHLLTDAEAVVAFGGSKMRKSILVTRIDKEDADYYLVPFDKWVEKEKRFLTSGVIILDKKEGYFKEASWTEKPERFLNINKTEAIGLMRRFIIKDFSNELRKLPTRSKIRYVLQRRSLNYKYTKLLRYLNNSKAKLIWQPCSYSSSPYQPYWKIDTNGYIWYVTQEGKVFPETELKIILNEIEANRLFVERFLRNY